MILGENLGGKGTVRGSTPSREVWGHASPEKFLMFRPPEITSGAFFRPFVVSNDMMR